ncbi:MAG: DUF488 domain-containing protein [Armatimonadetes bacterium]|nr:DUF488 domain-containing protein [Armatimonadota bacterium]
MLKARAIEVLVDVRTPAECAPGFQKAELRAAVEDNGISYKSLAPLPGIDWMADGSRHWRVALLCSEDDPARGCHRSLMSQMLSARGVRVRPLQDRIQNGTASQKGVEVFTIGVTRHSAPEFFGALRQAGIKRLLDVRLNNWTQLAGFTKRDDLPFFLEELCAAEYVHEPLLAPTRELLDDYKRHGGDWEQYEQDFLALMAERQVEKQISVKFFDIPTVLLCYEPEADFCHRRLVLEYLQEKWGCLKITHL